MSTSPRRLEATSEWPAWARYVADLIPVAVLLAALAQRHAFSHPTAQVWLFAAIAALPWLLDLVHVHLPHPFFAGTVIVGVAGLLVHPANGDMIGFVAVYLAGQVGTECQVRMGLPIAVVECAGIVALELDGRYPNTTPWLAGILLAWIAGAAYHAQQGTLAMLKEAQAGLAAKAAAEERQRIAREVHDVIAHSLTVTLLHITGARLAVRREPDEAVEALEEAERLARQSLAEIRQTVGLLKTGEVGSELGPMPGAGDIGRLVDEFSSAGLAVDASIDGSLDDLPAEIGLGLYRIVQESLANVAKHAPGTSAHLTLVVTPDGIRLSVHNARPRTGDERGTGVGLVGMAERAAVLGGDCVAGPAGEGWAVEVCIPRLAVAR